MKARGRIGAATGPDPPLPEAAADLGDEPTFVTLTFNHLR